MLAAPAAAVGKWYPPQTFSHTYRLVYAGYRGALTHWLDIAADAFCAVIGLAVVVFVIMLVLLITGTTS